MSMKTDAKQMNVTAFVIIVLASLAFFGGYIQNTYQTDSYSYVFYPYQNGYVKMIKDQGRYFQWFYFAPWFLFGINPATMPGVQVAVALAVNCLVMYLVWRKLSAYLDIESYEAKYQWILLLLIISMRLNVFESDIIQYGYFSVPTFLGDFFALLSAIVLSENKRKHSFIISGVLLIISITFMQPCVFWFVLYSIMFLFCEFMNNKQQIHVIREIGKRIAIYSSACFWQLILFGLIIRPQSGRGALSRINIRESLVGIGETLVSLLRDSMGVMPAYFYTTCLFFGMALLIISIVKTEKKKYIFILPLMSILGVFLAIFVPCFADGWMAHRAIVGYMTLLPFICWLVFVFILECWSFNRYIFSFLTLIIIVNLAVNWFYTSSIYKQQVWINAIDQQEIKFYMVQIEAYESNTGNQITKLATAPDLNVTNVFPGTTSPKSINDRAMETPWGIRAIFPFVSGRNFEMVDFDLAVFETYFVGKDWNVISEEQVLCIGDTAYIVWY